MMQVLDSPARVEWNRLDKKQVEEAKCIYRKARSEGKKIRDEKGQIVEFFDPDFELLMITHELTEDEMAMRVLDESGDRRLVWNANDPKQVKEAMKKFQKYLDDGYRIYTIDSKGNRAKRIKKFDSDLQEVIIEDETLAVKFENFVKKFKVKEMVALPRIRPG